MISSPQRPRKISSGKKSVVFLVGLMFALGLTLFVVTRHRPLPVTPLPEIHRKNLEMRDGVWYQPGHTNGFTGLLLDTYEEGALKSRSAVSNGLLHGLSQGWYTNGQQQVEEHFLAGISEGVRTKWHPNGGKLSEVAIASGKLQGTFRSWHDNGMPAEEAMLKDGEPEGTSKAWFSSGFLKSQVTLRNGKIVEKQFYKDGEHPERTITSPTELSIKIR
jgi:antitoxin component YwqK of YwqJK toxin-antitoxin module